MGEELINKTFLDRLTKLDDLSAENIKAVNRAGNNITAALDQLLGSLGIPSVRIHQDSNYPLTGMKEITLPAGKTKGIVLFDIKEGRVILPDGSVEDMSQPISDEICRSVYIITDKEIDVNILEGDRTEVTTSIFPVQWRKTYVEFDSIKLTITTNTNLYIIVSTEPEGVPETVLSDYYEGNPYVTRGNIALLAPVTIDVRTNLGRNGHIGFLANVGPLLGDLHVYEYDGKTWTTEYYTIVKDGVENFEKADISQLKLEAAVAGVNYELNMR